ncbi:MAG: type III pantothenate kinase [Cytophagaceae bacterium]|nr:type III pantothenate kinase [Cytophagaceae bacterium]
MLPTSEIHSTFDLSIDLGNTFAKTGLFREDTLEETRWRLTLDELINYVGAVRPRRLMLSSVGRTEAELRADFEPFAAELYFLNPQMPVPITKNYETPQTLGADRVAAAVGARALHPADNCLVIDMGTCITYDFVDRHDVFHGGLISPGLRMRFRAMHSFTQRLPELDVDGVIPPLVGKNTRHAMQSGVMNGLVAELNGIIAQYRVLHPDFQTIVCGGDARFFESSFQTPIFAYPELVLVGLNRILKHNVHLRE